MCDEAGPRPEPALPDLAGDLWGDDGACRKPPSEVLSLRRVLVRRHSCEFYQPLWVMPTNHLQCFRKVGLPSTEDDRYPACATRLGRAVLACSPTETDACLRVIHPLAAAHGLRCEHHSLLPRSPGLRRLAGCRRFAPSTSGADRAPLRYGGSARELIGGAHDLRRGRRDVRGALLPLGPAVRYVGARAEPSAAVGGWVLQPRPCSHRRAGPEACRTASGGGV